MTRHATTLVRDHPIAVPVQVQVAWPALVARDELGRSSNALLEPGAPTTPAISESAATLRPHPVTTSPLRRIRIVATIEAIPERSDRVRFAVHLEEDGQHRIAVPPQIVPGSISTVGPHLHAVVDGDEDSGWASRLTVVVDDTDRELMVRGRLEEIAGLPPGAAGRPTVAVTRPERPGTNGHYRPDEH